MNIFSSGFALLVLTVLGVAARRRSANILNETTITSAGQGCPYNAARCIEFCQWRFLKAGVCAGVLCSCRNSANLLEPTTTTTTSTTGE